jgi:radical SAM-linked protein
MARYIAKFNKGYEVKFISHLDLMRCVQRAIRRAEIPISYSKGFNPHAEISFASPLSVGTWSIGEYIDFNLDCSISQESVMDKINNELPGGIKLNQVREVDDKFPSLMSIVEAASYEVTIVNVDGGNSTKDFLDDFMKMAKIEVIKVGKKGEKTIDIRPMIRNIRLESWNEDIVIISTLVDTGSKSNLNPELIIQAIKLFVKGFKDAEIRDIKKIETYVKRDGMFKTPIELL